MVTFFLFILQVIPPTCQSTKIIYKSRHSKFTSIPGDPHFGHQDSLRAAPGAASNTTRLHPLRAATEGGAGAGGGGGLEELPRASGRATLGAAGGEGPRAFDAGSSSATVVWLEIQISPGWDVGDLFGHFGRCKFRLTVGSFLRWNMSSHIEPKFMLKADTDTALLKTVFFARNTQRRVPVTFVRSFFHAKGTCPIYEKHMGLTSYDKDGQR